MNDSVDEEIMTPIAKAALFIEEALDNNGKILIHCQQVSLFHSLILDLGPLAISGAMHCLFDLSQRSLPCGCYQSGSSASRSDVSKHRFCSHSEEVGAPPEARRERGSTQPL